MITMKTAFLRLLVALLIWSIPGQVHVFVEVNPTVVVDKCDTKPGWSLPHYSE